MWDGVEMVLTGAAGAEFYELVAREFDDPPALAAEKMVVGIFPVAELVVSSLGIKSHLLEDSAVNQKGEPWPRQHIDSPWYLAASGRENSPFKGTKGRYYPMMTFAPEIVAAARPYARRNNQPKIWENERDLNRLYAGYLYRTWVARRERANER